MMGWTITAARHKDIGAALQLLFAQSAPEELDHRVERLLRWVSSSPTPCASPAKGFRSWAPCSPRQPPAASASSGRRRQLRASNDKPWRTFVQDVLTWLGGQGVRVCQALLRPERADPRSPAPQEWLSPHHHAQLPQEPPGRKPGRRADSRLRTFQRRAVRDLRRHVAAHLRGYARLSRAERRPLHRPDAGRPSSSRPLRSSALVACPSGSRAGRPSAHQCPDRQEGLGDHLHGADPQQAQAEALAGSSWRRHCTRPDRHA